MWRRHRLHQLGTQRGIDAQGRSDFPAVLPIPGGHLLFKKLPQNDQSKMDGHSDIYTVEGVALPRIFVLD